MRSAIHQSHSHSRSAGSGFTLTELLVTCVIIGLLILILLPAIKHAKDAPVGPRIQCKNCLKPIALALHNYHDKYGSFPPPFTLDSRGTRLHSWRTLLLPFLDEESLYRSIDLTKAWNDPANAAAAARPLSWYRCPSLGGEPTRTTYLAVVAPTGVFSQGGGTSLQQITDGPSNTFLVAEVNSTRSVHWMSPFDLGEASLLGMSNESSPPHSEGFNVVFADGSTRTITREELARHARAWLTINGGEKVD